jgi:hypothetical protein
VDEEEVFTCDGQRQRFQKGALAALELRARPGDGGHRIAVELGVLLADGGGIVVAENDDGAVRGILLDELEDRYRVRSIPDEVTEKGVAIHAQRVGVCEARGDRLEVAVDVGEESELQ